MEVLKKMHYKQQEQSAVLNAPEGYAFGLQETLPNPGGFVLLFARNTNEVKEWLPKVMPVLTEDAVFWIAYPKKPAKLETDLNRDVLNACVQGATPFRAVSNVAIDDKWSALRFRPADKVKSKG
ncbi:hypothetical protein ACE3NQ_12685 [Paenibacillus terreus]|uniref:DUF3052 domain-containing protein n=1 Tax=Paenibacillus terreus TaxID=1387834 RepID=A0ABV5B7U2_9BACL